MVDGRGARRDGPIVLLNNSRDTFTSTASGAIATFIWEVCREARRAGVQPWVITRSALGETYDWPRLRLLPAYREISGPIGRGLRGVRRLTGWASVGQRSYAWRAAREIARLQPRAVVCHNDPEIAAYLRRRFPDITIVHWFHNVELASDRWRRRITEDRELVDVAVSDYLTEAVGRLYFVGTVRTVHNGVDAERFRPSSPGGDRPCVLGFTGRLGVEKAPDMFLRACLRLAQERSDFAVQMIGDAGWGGVGSSPFRDSLDDLCQQVRDAGVDVVRTGHVPRADLPEQLGEIDILVLPSRWDEPCSLVVLEGMATGLALVVTACGGNPELVGDAALMFPRDDLATLVSRLNLLLDDPAARRALGTRARERALELSWQATWQGLATACGVVEPV